MNRTATARALSTDDDGPARGAVVQARPAPAGSIQPAVPERLWLFLDGENEERPARQGALPVGGHACPEPWAALLAAGVRVVPRLRR